MRPVGELTAKARIQHAAMRLIAEVGFLAATMRTVAEAAGVTPGLVSHHFGSKQGLREACDAYVLNYLRDVIKDGVDEGNVADPAYLRTIYDHAPVVMRYVARAFVDESEDTARLFDSMVELTEQFLADHPPRGMSPASDTRTMAAVFVAMRLGVWVLHTHVLRAVGEDTLTPALLTRFSAAVLELVSPDFTGADLGELARAGLRDYQRTTTEGN